MRAIVMVLIAGCGRIDFDPLGSGDATAIGDAVSFDTPAGCVFGPWSPLVIEPNVNSSDKEFGPALRADGLELIFMTTRAGTLGADDLYDATRADVSQPFGVPSPLANINTADDEEGPTLSTDGLTLYFDSDRSGTRELYKATRATTSSSFDPPTIVPGLDNIAGPSISADGTELFITLLDTTEDLARATSFETSPVIQPLDSLNTATANEGWPTISGDGLTIYYELDQAPYGIYRAQRPAIGAPFAPAVLDDQLNDTMMEETDPEISRDGTTFMVSTNPGASFDLYRATRTCQ